jgi:hypothetical protein
MKNGMVSDPKRFKILISVSSEPMKICVSYPVDVCYVIIYTKKNGVNQNIEMLLMPVLLPAIPPTFFTRPESGFGLSLNPLASFVFLLVNFLRLLCLQ